MKELKTEEEIMANWKDDISKPLVTIRCITYNHEPFIEDALEGFLIQETNFPFEIVIHDDASTDRTAEIIRTYEAVYPNLIRPIYQKENQWSKKNDGMSKALKNKTRGKYCASCEGDDYWTDKLKLQRQADFLESHPDFSLCTHDNLFKYEHKNVEPVIMSERISYLQPEELIKRKIPDENAYKIELLDFCKNLSGIHTCTIMYRRDLFDLKPKWAYKMVSGDYVRNIELLKHGDGVWLPHVMSVSRKHPGGITQIKRNNLDSFLLNIYQQRRLADNVPDNCKFYFYQRMIKTYFKMLIGYKKYKIPVRKRVQHLPGLFKPILGTIRYAFTTE